MPTASAAHIKLDDDEFMLDRSAEPHYSKRWYDVDDEENPNITGDPGKMKRNAESLFWTYTDWAGGEGNRVYDPEQPDTYDIGYEINPRYRGQLHGRPNRRRATVTTTDTNARPCMAIGNQAVWLGGGYDLAHSITGPVSWTEKAHSTTAAADYIGLRSLSTSYRITAMVGDNDYIYFTAWHAGSSGSRALLRTVRSDAALCDTVETQQTSVAPYAGLCMMNGKLFGWTGRRLTRMDTTGTAANISTTVSGGVTTALGSKEKVFDSRVDPASSNVFSTDWWADCNATENSIVMWYSNSGVSEVYEYKKGVGKPIWRPPYGFTIKSSCYSNGVMFFAGHWGADANDGADTAGRGVLYALPLDSYRPFPVKHVRLGKDQNLQMQEMHASYGYQIITVAQRSGRIFIYDAEADGFSMLDTIGGTSGDSMVFTANSNRIAGSVTWGKNRYFAIYKPGDAAGTDGSYQVAVYDDDDPNQAEIKMNTTDYTNYKGWFETPRWDYGYPLDKKSLIGFHLTFKPLTAGQTLDVMYDHLEAGAAETATDWTTLTQITSSTTGASVGRVFLPVSLSGAQKKFMTLKYRVTLGSTTGTSVAPPILYAVSAEAKLIRKRKEWLLTIRVKDEPSRNARPSHRQSRGWRLRDYLEETIEAGNAIVFRDGYRYKGEALYSTTFYSTHNVIIKEAEDIINKEGEGTMRILLRDIDKQDDA
jgi:hypothetical protein